MPPMTEDDIRAAEGDYRVDHCGRIKPGTSVNVHFRSTEWEAGTHMDGELVSISDIGVTILTGSPRNGRFIHFYPMDQILAVIVEP